MFLSITNALIKPFSKTIDDIYITSIITFILISKNVKYYNVLYTHIVEKNTPFLSGLI